MESIVATLEQMGISVGSPDKSPTELDWHRAETDMFPWQPTKFDSEFKAVSTDLSLRPIGRKHFLIFTPCATDLNYSLSHANMCRLFPSVSKLKIKLFPEAHGAFMISKSIGRLRLLAQPTQVDHALTWKYVVADVGSQVIETYDPPLRDLLISMICRDDRLGPLGQRFAQRAGLGP